MLYVLDTNSTPNSLPDACIFIFILFTHCNSDGMTLSDTNTRTHTLKNVVLKTFSYDNRNKSTECREHMTGLVAGDMLKMECREEAKRRKRS